MTRLVRIDAPIVAVVVAIGTIMSGAAGAQGIDDPQIDLGVGERAGPAAASVPASTSLVLPTRKAAASRRGSNLFESRSWYTPPPPPAPRPAPPPPAPTAPPLPFTYVGSFEQGDVMVYYLTRGDRAYDVKIGDVIDDTYSVDREAEGQLVLTYLPLKTVQTLPLGR